MRHNPPGLYEKFTVLKNGEPTSENSFVLFPESDVHAVCAIRAYAESCRKDNPELTIDLLTWTTNVLEAAIGESENE